MKIQKSVLCYIMILCVSVPVFACDQVADAEKDENLYKFSFSFEGENLVLHREINSQPSEDLLDDTGYLGIRVGLASIIDGKEPTVRYAKNKAQIAFVKERIDTYLKAIKPVTSEDTEQMAIKEKIIQQLGKLKQLIDQDPSSNDIHALWKSIESMNPKFVTISAKARKDSGAAWGDEKLLKSFTLPAPKLHDATKPKTRCFTLPYVDMELETYNPPRTPTRGKDPQTKDAIGIPG